MVRAQLHDMLYCLPAKGDPGSILGGDKFFGSACFTLALGLINILLSLQNLYCCQQYGCYKKLALAEPWDPLQGGQAASRALAGHESNCWLM